MLNDVWEELSCVSKGVNNTYIHTYIFISQIQFLHQLHLNMKHVNKYQTTQNTKKNTYEEKNAQEKMKHTHTEKITGVNQSITPGHHIQQNYYMHRANCNII
jgi:hypothetical protein